MGNWKFTNNKRKTTTLRIAWNKYIFSISVSTGVLAIFCFFLEGERANFDFLLLARFIQATMKISQKKGTLGSDEERFLFIFFALWIFSPLPLTSLKKVLNYDLHIIFICKYIRKFYSNWLTFSSYVFSCLNYTYSSFNIRKRRVVKKTPCNELLQLAIYTSLIFLQ